MAKVNRKVKLKASKDTVWDYITDPEKMKLWRNDIIEIKLPEKGLGVGDTYGLRKREGKREFEYVCTVTSIIENQQFSFTAKSNMADVVGIYRIEEKEDGTEFELEEEIKLKGIIGTILDWLILPSMLNKAIERITNNMRAVIDGDGEVISP